jgi:hypothetical protein
VAGLAPHSYQNCILSSSRASSQSQEIVYDSDDSLLLNRLRNRLGCPEGRIRARKAQASTRLEEQDWLHCPGDSRKLRGFRLPLVRTQMLACHMRELHKEENERRGHISSCHPPPAAYSFSLPSKPRCKAPGPFEYDLIATDI